jgi:hypothetical protein
MGDAKELVVWGFDPGNASSGVSMFVGEELRWHATIAPHDVESAYWSFELDPAKNYRHVVYCEVPANGTHASRGGVHFAGGMLLAMLNHQLGETVPRGNIRKVKPSAWRGWASFPKKPTDEVPDLKEHAIRTVREKFGAEVESDDEAEAILIGWIGAVREGCF